MDLDALLASKKTTYGEFQGDPTVREWAHLPMEAFDALVLRLRVAEDRLQILNDPGTLTAITQGMWDYAESKGHPKASSFHAYGFLVDLIERLEREVNDLRTTFWKIKAYADADEYIRTALAAVEPKDPGIPKDV